MLAWFRHAYIEYHAHVRLRFKLAAGHGEPWTRDGGIPQGCPLSMMFIVALYLPWCKCLAAQEGFSLSCMLIILSLCIEGPRCALACGWVHCWCVRLVGQEPAPGKCVLMSRSWVVRNNMRDWILFREGDKWTVA